MQELPLDPAITAISPACLNLLALDISHFSSFISRLSLPTSALTSTSAGNERTDPLALRRTVDELTQTIALMKSGNPEEFYDIDQRDRKYGAVNAQNGPVLLEKVEKGKEIGSSGEGQSSMDVSRTAKASDRFGNVIRGFRRGTESDHNRGVS